MINTIATSLVLVILALPIIGCDQTASTPEAELASTPEAE